jgi:hypothetical protein
MAHLNLSTVESFKIKFHLCKTLDWLIIGALASYHWVPLPPDISSFNLGVVNWSQTYSTNWISNRFGFLTRSFWLSNTYKCHGDVHIVPNESKGHWWQRSFIARNVWHRCVARLSSASISFFSSRRFTPLFGCMKCHQREISFIECELHRYKDCESETNLAMYKYTSSFNVYSYRLAMQVCTIVDAFRGMLV